QKGLGWLLEAYAMLPDPLRFDLVLAGFSNQWDEVKAKISSLGLTSRVRLTGRYDAAQRLRLLEDCRFVCFPSPNETFGLGLAESCAAGRPAIHFDIPPMNEV